MTILDMIAEKLYIKSPASKEESAESKETDAKKGPVFDNYKITVVFVLGGPGAGKGTQCEKLVQEFGFCHLSAGDLLRAEQNREGSQYGAMIKQYIKDGQIVPMEVTIKLLENAMRATLEEGRPDQGWTNGQGRFLVDGFPRKMDQALKFDEDVCLSSLVLFYTTTEEVMLKRLLKRSETSGREDDNEESIKKRFRVYKETTMPVIEHYNKLHKVAEIDGSPSVDKVYEKGAKVVRELLAGKLGGNVTA
ncbi:UMP-CMP kinase [Thelephora ganbajun]|uniref:UMP-CMP kinase n=1 Tax=Thelephora ganbajun TaxID=370292 RepID=A0ACB6ZVM6_THEGA|nr:UMP-CMP kinase [Thelephora ganbajun]